MNYFIYSDAFRADAGEHHAEFKEWLDELTLIGGIPLPPSSAVEGALKNAVCRPGFLAVLLQQIEDFTIEWQDDTEFYKWLHGFLVEVTKSPDTYRSVLILQLLTKVKGMFGPAHACIRSACYLDTSLRENLELLTHVVTRGMLALLDTFTAGVLLQGREIIIAAASEMHISSVYSISAAYFGNKIPGFCSVFHSLPVEVRGNRAIAAAFLSTGACLLDAPHELRRDRELVERAVKFDAYNICGADLTSFNESCKEDMIFLKGVASRIPDHFFANVTVLKFHGIQYKCEYNGWKYNDNQELACAALIGQQDIRRAGHKYRVLPQLSARLRSTIDVVLLAFRKNDGRSNDQWKANWASVDSKLKEDIGFLQKVLEMDFDKFQLLPPDQRSNRPLVLALVKSDPDTLRHVDPCIWTDGPEPASFCLALLRTNRECWRYIPLMIKDELGLKIFECPICFSLPRGQVRQCPNGHRVCADCVGQLPKKDVCHTCRCIVPKDPYGSRCLFAEQMLEDELSGRAHKRLRCNTFQLTLEELKILRR